MAMTETGWERNKRVHFDDVVASYDRIRPTYPTALFEDLFAYAAPSEGKRALEIGAGTGKATAPVLNAGYAVTAVEIGPNMADFLLEQFCGEEGFQVVRSSFEEAQLQENSYDLIYAASAFHWVDAEIGCPKALRLLKDGGAVALFRYHAIAAPGDPLYDEIQAVYETHYYSHYTLNSRPVKKTRADFRKKSECYLSYRFEDLREYGFREIAMKFYDGAKTYGAEEYILLLETMSDHRSLPDQNREALYAGVKDAIERHGGEYTVDYLFQLYLGRK